MIVEDNLLNQRLFSSLITMLGYKVCVLDRGDGFMEHVEACQPDMILMDIQLPDRDGDDLLVDLRKKVEYNSTVVVAVTAYALAGDREKFLMAGFDDYVGKPIETADFVKLIHRHLEDGY